MACFDAYGIVGEHDSPHLTVIAVGEGIAVGAWDVEDAGPPKTQNPPSLLCCVIWLCH
jgi:hypothetical protein